MLKWLKELNQDEVKRVGGKAASLSAMLKEGFLVPNGFVLSFSNHTNDVDNYRWGIKSFYSQMGNNVSVAVRSSASGEDGKEHSFAGQYSTYLNVNGWEGIVSAVKRCCFSLTNKRAQEYRESKGITGDNYMSVVVQEMVPARFSGVMFTKDPITNDESKIYIETTEGLGDKLVGGTVTPSLYVIEKKEFKVVEEHVTSGPRIFMVDLKALCNVGKDIEKFFKSPQDIEFCITKMGLPYIVQARPITT